MPLPIVLLFQFTPLREGRLSSMPRYTQPRIFQFTPLREGRLTFERAYSRALSEFQFTPLREGRRPPPSRLQAAFYFNSRPSARGDRHRRRIVAARRNFNSRPSARGDKGGEADHQAAEISIHAPPRGATYGEIRAATRRIFQFTLLREGRPDRYRSISSRAYFNSRPSARGDGIASSKSRSASNFNSRPSARGDVPSVLHSY